MLDVTVPGASGTMDVSHVMHTYVAASGTTTVMVKRLP
jgi:hypothetical protein